MCLVVVPLRNNNKKRASAGWIIVIRWLMQQNKPFASFGTRSGYFDKRVSLI
jgi:hypothetical protein